MTKITLDKAVLTNLNYLKHQCPWEDIEEKLKTLSDANNNGGINKEQLEDLSKITGISDTARGRQVQMIINTKFSK